MKEFYFYLDAWSYCWHHEIDIKNIKRKDWKTWVVDSYDEISN